MELKLRCQELVPTSFLLLIVPYGIETKIVKLQNYLMKLLIVPYGIETSHGGERYVRSRLLIVPYGIETGFSFL